MMSIAALGVGLSAANYCIGSTREDYYASGGDPLGVWQGSGSAKLGLEGQVEAKAFTAVLQGLHPKTGAALTGSGSGATAHRAGWDCTFSAPKSVSVLWALSDSQARLAIEQAHDAAIRSALQYLETHAAYTRRGHGGSEQEAVQGLVAATFKHFTSRAGDPQLHTHCIVMNVAPREDGSIGTIDSKHLFDHKMAAGAVYRMALGTELAKQGYRLEDSKHGFELQGITRELRQLFSKRREQIEQALADHGGKSAAASQIAALSTRQSKEESHLEERLAYWQEESRGIQTQFPVPRNTQKSQVEIDSTEVIKGLTRGQSTFTHRDLVRAIAIAGVGTLDYEGLQTTVNRLIQDRTLIRLGQAHQPTTRYTTSEILDLETRCLETAATLAEQRANTITAERVRSIALRVQQIDSIELSDEQSQAVQHIATETGRIALIEGLAGTGKTQMLRTARCVFEDSGFCVHGCALSGKAAQNLEEGSGIRSQTLHRLLATLDRKQALLTAKDLVVLDEAAMVGSRQMEALLGHITRAGAKIVMVGDSHQLQPVDAGQMFGTLVRELGKSDLKDMRRQNQAWARDAVLAVIEGQSSRAISAFNEHGLVSRAADAATSVANLTEHWAADPLPMQNKLVLAGTRLEVYRLNQSIRKAMQDAHAVSGPEIEFETSQGGLRRLATGDRVVFLRNDLGLGVKNGTLGVVTGCSSDVKKPIVSVQIDGGSTIDVPLASYAHLDHGYALTVHKAQGTTVDGNVYVMASDVMTDREWAYVALSRAKGNTRIYTAGIEDEELLRDMRRSRRKDTSLDYERDQPLEP
jgi:Ti-type conjugative transfer relaxase TraA